MKENTSHRKYRAYKLAILALLIFSAAGLTYLFKDQFKAGDRQWGLKATTVSMGADVKQPSDDSMPQTRMIKDAIMETMTDSREKAGALASAVAVKANQVAADGEVEIGRMTSKVHDVSYTAPADPLDRLLLEQRPAIPLLTRIPVEGRTRKIVDMHRKDATTHSARWCVGPTEKGKDLGTRYIVASCESLSIISERTGIGVNDLINQNPEVKNPDLIYPNQELQLPPRG